MRRLPGFALGAALALACVTTFANAAYADDGEAQLTAGQLACVKRILTPAQFAQAMEDFGSLPPSIEAKIRKACFSGSLGAVATKGRWITANPVDLQHVTAISHFRSCAGHDYSGFNIDGQQERDRSMKHYVLTDEPWAAAHSIRGYAPFSGTVRITNEQFPLGKQMRIYDAGTGWSFVFFHGDPLVANGAKVKAGQPVIAWPPNDVAAVAGSHDPNASFDIALVSDDGRYESPLSHMSPAVARQWAAKGFTPRTSIVTKADRDAEPCGGVFDSDPSEYVQVRRP